ncbi:acetyl-CoA C-acetyltransferase [Tieghemostelium lacteum]|uniref:acetyl-CoA C-acetyltransferase n=1 Tax=Tieghemostelium lacteum TaxID=361077 RepID=A0A151ZBT1_TIELA|nr:acetyl-CoA C-acetyltransferase [Tieghemostelium lacteum]|eukprot:KYQ91344.1 acetyl-CoA C-acetyltransferase [Tieghemostelium lacteum]
MIRLRMFISKFKNIYQPLNRYYSTTVGSDGVVIVSAVRTAIGSMGGILSGVPGTKLSSITIKEALKKANIKPSQVDEVIIGNVIGSNVGQAPAKQCAKGAGIEDSAVCTTINKVCSSGMKSIMLGAQSIQLGHSDIVVVGGFESMSQVPYYVEKLRFGAKYGNTTLVDGLVRDGLADAYDGSAMGTCSDDTAKKHKLTRKEVDDFAILSYTRAVNAQKNGLFDDEIVPVSIPQKNAADIIIKEDEEPKKAKFDKIPTLKPVFTADGTTTAANASKINDGASSLVLVKESVAKKLGLKPLARILGYADAEQAPIDFPTSPAKAIPKALKRAGIDIKDVDYFEINEAFASVPLANAKILNIDINKVNVNGGGVSLGHPIGSSGARIVTTLTHILQKDANAKYGVAGICNGGGGASAIVIEKC